MAEAAVNFLIDKLTNILENELQFFRDAEEEVRSVRGHLECVRACLRVADSLEESDEEVKVWVKQLREIAYDTEDTLDKFKLLSAHDHGVGFAGLFCAVPSLGAAGLFAHHAWDCAQGRDVRDRSRSRYAHGWLTVRRTFC